MKKNSVVTKLGILISLLFLSILIPFAFFIYQIFINVYSLYLNENVKSFGDRIEQAIATNTGSSNSLYQEINILTDDTLVFFDNKGTIQYGQFLEFQAGTTLSSDWITRLKTDEYLEGERYSKNTDESIYYAIKPFNYDGQFHGGVMIFSSISELHLKMHSVREWIFRAIVGAIVLALLYTLFLTWRLSRPLIKMEKATRDIAKGNLDVHIPVTSKDEVGSLAQAINDLSVELNDFRKNRSEFLANISHELRTPTSYLKGYANLIHTQQYKSEEDLKHYAHIIESESNRLSNLIQDLFELSKMEEGSIKLYTQEIDLEDLVESIIEKIELKSKSNNNIIHMNVQKNIPSMYTDGLRLEQILLNLIENANNYTDNGEITVEISMNNKQVQFTVKDNGPGIPEEDLPFIFNRFYRVEKSRDRNLGGSGLGLAIVYELTNQLSGQIEVTSNYGEGTIFTLTLPLSIENC